VEVRVFKVNKLLGFLVVKMLPAVRGTLIIDVEGLLHVNLLFLFLATNTLHTLVDPLTISQKNYALIFFHLGIKFN
jgi:hypothetical protein